MSYIPLTAIDLMLAGSLLLINGIVSVAFRLGLARNLGFSAFRMVVQLTAVGFALKFIFAQTSPAWTVALACAMLMVAAREALARQAQRFEGWHAYALTLATLTTTGLFTTLFTVAIILQPDPWYAPRYVLVILGMILGNALTGIALALDTFTTTAKRERIAIEARLALGHARSEALAGVLRAALRSGMMPIINSMAATGIVALPGMMTGQILSGVNPVDAARYQILITFLIAGSTALGVLLSGLFGLRLITDDRHRLRLDRLVQK